MTAIRPIYKKLLIAVIVIYVIGSCIMQVDLCQRIAKIEHALTHLSEHEGH